MPQETNPGNAVITAIRADSTASLAKEYAEIGIDSALESGLLKDIPFVNTVVAAIQIGPTIRDALLAAKLVKFINGIATINEYDRKKLISDLNGSDKFAGRAGAAIIEILDRMESERKPEIAAKCFVAFAKGRIQFIELRRILLALERIPTHDISELRNFASLNLSLRISADEGMYLAFSTAGLAKNNGGLDGGAFIPTQLCKLILELELDR